MCPRSYWLFLLLLLLLLFLRKHQALQQLLLK
jgi:hypothetical protein